MNFTHETKSIKHTTLSIKYTMIDIFLMNTKHVTPNTTTINVGYQI